MSVPPSQGGAGAVTWPGRLRVKGCYSRRGLRLDQKKPSWWFQEWSLAPAFDSEGLTVVGSVGEKQDEPGPSCQSGKAQDQGNEQVSREEKAGLTQAVAGKLGVCPDLQI